MDITRELRLAISSGRVYFGFKQALKAQEKKEAKLFILSDNCPRDFEEQLQGRKYRFRGNSRTLGEVCGKRFAVSVLTVVDEGDSSILQLR